MIDIGLQIMPGWVMFGLTYMSRRGLSADGLYLDEVTQHVRRQQLDGRHSLTLEDDEGYGDNGFFGVFLGNEDIALMTQYIQT